jgi:F-type H+-transporting ATPase subunit b
MKMIRRNILVLILAAGLCAGFSGAVLAEAGHGETEHPTANELSHTAGHDGSATTTAAGHGEEHGASHSAPMVTKEKLKDLLWRTLNFAALIIILVKFGGKPVTEALNSRRRTIEEDLNSLQAKRDGAERSYQEFEARLAGMEQEIRQTVQRAMEMAEEERHRILAAAEEEARNIRRQAEAAVAAAVALAQHQLQNEVAEQAVAMAEQLIVKNLTPADHAAIIEQYLDKAGAAQQL